MLTLQTIRDKFFKHLPAIIFAIFVLAVAGHSYIVDYLPAQRVENRQNAQLAALLATAPEHFELGGRIQETDCVAEGPLPDRDCTPGAIFENATKEVICVKGYSSTVRSVSTSLKKKVFAEYGIEYPVPFGSYEIDHLIPLSLGGSNEVANLWPKAAEPWPGFYEKNITGNYLLAEVCAGNIDLSIAQKRIASDWFLIYSNLSESTVKELKNKYKNWAARKP
ncbi:MAG TPA: HNH endonuclease signature motif containing protein [Negativicutes bacterium]|nr:HNH endonuclease signature motif containing protein [Negativicutes bacterium]